MMRVISLLGVFACFSLWSFTSAAQDAVLDQEYKLISPPQETETGPKKVEIVEVFSYACPHCFAFEPHLKKWKAGASKDAVMKYMPAMFGESQAPAAKLFYAIEEMGLVEKLHEKIYDEVHVNHNTEMLSDSALMAKFLGTQGVDTKRFQEIFDSFGVANKVSRAAQLMRGYRISGTPSVVVNGKYLTGPSMTMGSNGVDYERFFAVVDQLIAKELPRRKEVKKKRK